MLLKSEGEWGAVTRRKDAKGEGRRAKGEGRRAQEVGWVDSDGG
jgi:hypothetical protein